MAFPSLTTYFIIPEKVLDSCVKKNTHTFVMALSTVKCFKKNAHTVGGAAAGKKNLHFDLHGACEMRVKFDK